MPISLQCQMWLLLKIMPARLNNELDPSENADTVVFNLLRQENIARSAMQPRGPLPDENMFVALERDNLPPQRLTTAMNIGRGRATSTRSRKRKAKTTTDDEHPAECSGTARVRGRSGVRTGRKGARGGGRGRST
ncbi:hypothetical protein PVAP13_5NG150700 [Panicum virgatum]|uniref:Uncharacterized protein n=1 Tax=Panicum virgatum TaxID=38727 RepID=A0A8T0RN46_PANVG|nr:hypothetical protein PVAP13_5NG150700 [Panicum virgatum]